jgi:NADH:ubiquinone oxidoreductase subunit 3 (subunit A)
MSNLQAPAYRRADLIAGFMIISGVIIFALVGGIPGLITAIIGLGGMIVLTGVVWYAAGYILGGPAFEYFFVKRNHEPWLRRHHLLLYESEYFLARPGFPKSITWRFFQTFSIFLLFGSTIAYLFPSAGQRTPASETGPFLNAGLTAILVAMPLVALLWLYEDSGLRNQRRDNNTIIRVGTLFEQLLFGSGALSAFYRLVTSLAAPTAEVVGWVIALFVLLPSMCFLLTLSFHEISQLELVNRVLSVASANNFPKRDIRLV